MTIYHHDEDFFQYGQFTCWDEHQVKPLYTVLTNDISPHSKLISLSVKHNDIIKYITGTPAESTSEVRKWQDYHWKTEFKSFPTVYDMPIWSNICMSYTVG